MKNSGRHIFNKFKGLKTLVLMQLKERLNISFMADKKNALLKISLYALLLVGLTGIIYVLFFLLKFLGVLFEGGMPVSMFNIFFYILITVNILGCINDLTNTLFFSEDNLVLLSYPVKGNTIFFSKLLVFYILQLLKSFTTIVPLFIAYGIFGGFRIGFYPWLLFCFFLIAMLPVAIASVFTIPYMYIKTFFKQHLYLQNSLYFIFLIGITVLIFYLVDLIPENLEIATKWATVYFPAITNFTQQFEKFVGPLVFLPRLLMGYVPGGINNPTYLTIFNKYTFPILMGLIGVIIVCLVISNFAAKPLFFHMATRPFEYKKKKIKNDFTLHNDSGNIFTEYAFIPVLENSDINVINTLKKLLRRILNNQKIFEDGKIDDKQILSLLDKYQTGEEKIQFTAISYDEFKKKQTPGYIVVIDNNVPSLVVVQSFKKDKICCYDPKHLPHKNHPKNPYISALWKDILLSFRNPGEIWTNYLLFVAAPIAVLILNSIFEAMKQSSLGVNFTILFNVFIILMITLASSTTMASIYSREGNTSYLLKAAPVNYVSILSSKLIIRAIIMTGSIIFTTIVYSNHSSVLYIRFDLLFFSFWFVYLAHLLWSAELDFMNPQDHLYADAGQNVPNKNETLSAILVFIIAIVFAAIAFFLCWESISTAFIKLFFISLAFLIMRIILYVTKILGYRTSRAERSRE